MKANVLANQTSLSLPRPLLQNGPNGPIGVVAEMVAFKAPKATKHVTDFASTHNKPLLKAVKAKPFKNEPVPTQIPATGIFPLLNLLLPLVKTLWISTQD